MDKKKVQYVQVGIIGPTVVAVTGHFKVCPGGLRKYAESVSLLYQPQPSACSQSVTVISL